MRYLIISILLACSLFGLEGKVIKVSDGDTITLLDDAGEQHKIRFYGIDAPEKSQPFGKKSRENLASYIAGKRVGVDVRAKDRYGRNVGVVYLNRVDINARQVQDGYAWAYTQYGGKEYKELENSAREQRLGLWSEANPEEPWNYRKLKRNKDVSFNSNDEELVFELTKIVKALLK